jgi:ATP-dependent DNA helicase RecG
MALPINIDLLISGKTVEWERIEFKRSWNPLVAVQTIAAFANDVNNWGGGYLVIGIEEINGQPKLPPHGVEPGEVDGIQKELLSLCHELRPPYFPIVEPVEFMGKLILIIWVLAVRLGHTRRLRVLPSLATTGITLEGCHPLSLLVRPKKQI